MYKRENLIEGSKDVGEFGFLFCFVLFFVIYLFIIFDGFLAKKTTMGRRVVLMNGLGSSSLALKLVLECCKG